MKKIEVLHLKPSELKHDFGNPRKITEQKKEKLKKSLEIYGDHDIIKIDENHNIISGNQRVKAMIQLGIDTPILCKKLIGYSEKELKKINVDSNRHMGEWDYDILNEWGKEINLDFGIENVIDFTSIDRDNQGVASNWDQVKNGKNEYITIGNIQIKIDKELLEKIIHKINNIFENKETSYKEIIQEIFISWLNIV